MHHSYNTFNYGIKPKEPSDSQKKQIIEGFIAFLRSLGKQIAKKV